MIVGQEIDGISYSSEEIEDLISKWEEDKQNKEDMTIMLFPTILLQLLLKNRIDLSKIDDCDYLVRKVANFKEEIGFKNAFYIISIEDDFIRTAKDAMEANRNEVAIVLISIALEHTLNRHYRYLMRLNDINDEAITKLIRKFGFEDKTGWLMPLVFKMDLEHDFRNKLNKINELRNAIVHYKAVPFVLNDDDRAEDNCSSKNTVLSNFLADL